MAEQPWKDHLAWAKERARREYDFLKSQDPKRAITAAVASMISDLRKHPEGTKHLTVAGMLTMTVTDEASLFRFIDGFN